MASLYPVLMIKNISTTKYFMFVDMNIISKYFICKTDPFQFPDTHVYLPAIAL